MSTEADFSSAENGGDDHDERTDAIGRLSADHDEVKALFLAYDRFAGDGASDGDRAALVARICDALTAHATAEEEIFYPAARDAIDDPDLIEDAIAEHAEAKDLIAQLRDLDPADDLFDATVHLLRDAIEQHVQAEEGDLFPRVRRSPLDLQWLGEQIALREEDVLASLQPGED